MLGASVRHASALRAAAGWALAFAIFTVTAQYTVGAAGQWQFERVAFEGGAWWQLATSQWVHLSWPHAGMNAAAAALMLLALAGWVDVSTQCAALLGGYAGVALVVALDPACAYYAGASGALHGLLAGSGVKMALSKRSGPRVWRMTHALGLVMLVGLGIKLLFQHHGSNPSAPGWLGFSVYHPVHSGGAVGGAVAVVLMHLFFRHTLSQR